MIGIKMQMPKSCDKCKFCIDNGYLTSQCRLNFETVEDLRLNKIDKNCPLIDLGNEDMSWEDLKEKAKQFIEKTEKDVYGKEYFEINSLSFWQDGAVLDKHNDIISWKNQMPYQMWQIIQALVGER